MYPKRLICNSFASHPENPLNSLLQCWGWCLCRIHNDGTEEVLCKIRLHYIKGGSLNPQRSATQTTPRLMSSPPSDITPLYVGLYLYLYLCLCLCLFCFFFFVFAFVFVFFFLLSLYLYLNPERIAAHSPSFPQLLLFPSDIILHNHVSHSLVPK